MEKEDADNLAYVRGILQKEIDVLVERLRNIEAIEEKAEIIGRVNLIKYSQELLRRCFEYNISPRAIWRKVPEPEHAFSEYRLLEDFDSDNRESWKELEYIRPSGGAIIID